jgi:hypothetical protein
MRRRDRTAAGARDRTDRTPCPDKPGQRPDIHADTDRRPDGRPVCWSGADTVVIEKSVGGAHRESPIGSEAMHDRAIDAAALRAELKRLRRGYALRHPDLTDRLGPQARAAFGIEAGDPVPVVRRKAFACVSRILASDIALMTAALAALALHPEADQKRLTDRETWLAGRLHCDARTARRRVSQALDRFVDRLLEAEHAASLPAPASDDGFVVRTLWSTLRLDTARPQLHEKREIVVTGDRLETVAGSMTVPRPDGGPANELSVRVDAGGELSGVRPVSGEHFEFTILLPRVLRHGETHVYELTFAIPDGQPMRPHYVFQPLVHCERFELAVHFRPTAIPREVWLINGVAPRLLDAGPAVPARLQPSAQGTVRQSFSGLRQGLAYGVGWRP